MSKQIYSLTKHLWTKDNRLHIEIKLLYNVAELCNSRVNQQNDLEALGSRQVLISAVVLQWNKIWEKLANTYKYQVLEIIK